MKTSKTKVNTDTEQLSLDFSASKMIPTDESIYERVPEKAARIIHMDSRREIYKKILARTMK